MKDNIIQNICNPDILEKLYRQDTENFSNYFEDVTKDQDSDLIKFWKIRLARDVSPAKSKLKKRDFVATLLLSVLGAILIKIPTLFMIADASSFSQRNTALIIFNSLILYTIWKQKLFNRKNIIWYTSVILFLTFYLNILPGYKSDSIKLSFIHSALLLWCLFGFAYIGFDFKKIKKMTEFVRFCGELLIMSGLISIAGLLFSIMTIELFSALNLDIEIFYINYIMLIGGIITPLVSYYLIRLYPGLTSSIAPVIARIYAPLVLIMMAIYLVSFFFAEKPILNKREELLFFNLILLVVMATVLFSISELKRNNNKNLLILFILSVITCLINFVALVPIIERISLSLTPNRTVVLFSNILIFIHLILISKNSYLAYYKKAPLTSVDLAVTRYLPIYANWSIIVIFILPVLFGFQ